MQCVACTAILRGPNAEFGLVLSLEPVVTSSLECDLGLWVKLGL